MYIYIYSAVDLSCFSKRLSCFLERLWIRFVLDNSDSDVDGDGCLGAKRVGVEDTDMDMQTWRVRFRSVRCSKRCDQLRP